ncbi:hypothetical protein N0V90_004139 [Kalmusia sp. IMI 367209]|nr:hypothetical protein N0V90_004139 [Kalmusia sp. IMI 367209]
MQNIPPIPLANLGSFPESLQNITVGEERIRDAKFALWDLEGIQEDLVKSAQEKRRQFLIAAIKHSQTYCQEISDKIVRVLPREIRDMIYEYLCARIGRIAIAPVESVTSKLPWQDKANVDEELATSRQYPNRVRTKLPHFFSQKYVAKEFLVELASVLYPKVTFHVWDATDIDNYLNQDIFRVGCLPRNHVRKLSLVIFTDSYHQRCDSREGIEKKLHHLEQLYGIKHRQGFRLDLHLCISEMMHRPTVPRYHQILLPYLHDLKAAGFTVRLPLKKYEYGEGQKSIGSEMNQLQASKSGGPNEWVVDDEELDAWKDSKYIKNAFHPKAPKKYYESTYSYYNTDSSSGSSDATDLSDHSDIEEEAS